MVRSVVVGSYKNLGIKVLIDPVGLLGIHYIPMMKSKVGIVVHNAICFWFQTEIWKPESKSDDMHDLKTANT